jgi:hypothetical protein
LLKTTIDMGQKMVNQAQSCRGNSKQICYKEGRGKDSSENWENWEKLSARVTIIRGLIWAIDLDLKAGNTSSHSHIKLVVSLDTFPIYIYILFGGLHHDKIDAISPPYLAQVIAYADFF